MYVFFFPSLDVLKPITGNSRFFLHKPLQYLVFRHLLTATFSISCLSPALFFAFLLLGWAVLKQSARSMLCMASPILALSC